MEGSDQVTSKNFTALFFEVDALQKLKRLSLAKVHGIDGDYLRLIPRFNCAATLEALDLSRCNTATYEVIQEFARCPRLREVRLSHCTNVTGQCVRTLVLRSPRLEVLDITCITDVLDSLLKTIGQGCPFLRVLNIGNAKDVSDEGIGYIVRGCPRLEVLDLSWCGRITDISVLKIAQDIPYLCEVGLSETLVSDAGVSEVVRRCCRLEKISLAGCSNISNTAVGNIVTHCKTRLTYLNLASCKSVTDEYVEVIVEACPRLIYLDVVEKPGRMISMMVERVTRQRDIQIYF